MSNTSLINTQYQAYDIEATGLDAYRGARIFSWSTCDEKGVSSVHRFDMDKSQSQNYMKLLSIDELNSKILPSDIERNRLQSYLNDKNIHKICHNMHFDYVITQESGYNIPKDSTWHCTLIIWRLLDNLSPSNSLDDLAHKYFKYPKDQDKVISQAAKIYGNYALIPKNIMHPYQIADAERTMLLFQVGYPLIKKDPLLYADYLNELALIKATIKMERKGMMLCRSESLKLIDWLQDELKQVEQECIELLKVYVNFSSPKQVSILLYGYMGNQLCNQCEKPYKGWKNMICPHCKELSIKDNYTWPVITMNKSGLAPSSDKDALEELRERSYEFQMDEKAIQILDLILRHRSYTKGIAMINSYMIAADKNDIIHPHINTNDARTGRETSNNPDMQNISKETALKSRYPVPARKCFRARPKCILFLPDYSGIEMRLLVEATQQPEMLSMYLADRNADLHTVAAEVFYGPIFTDRKQCFDYFMSSNKKDKKAIQDTLKSHNEDEIEKLFKKYKKILRGATKNGQFGLAYGAGIPKLAETLMLSIEQATSAYNNYKDRFPEIAFYTKNMRNMARKTGYVTTAFGRRLRVRHDKPSAAGNYYIQGTAAGILKRAQVNLDNYFEEEWDDQISLLLPIHDEVIFEMPRSLLCHQDIILRDVRSIMIDMPQIKVPLEVEFKSTTYTWAMAKELKLSL